MTIKRGEDRDTWAYFDLTLCMQLKKSPNKVLKDFEKYKGPYISTLGVQC